MISQKGYSVDKNIRDISKVIKTVSNSSASRKFSMQKIVQQPVKSIGLTTPSKAVRIIRQGNNDHRQIQTQFQSPVQIEEIKMQKEIPPILESINVNDFDQTMISFLQTLDPQGAQNLKQSLKSGQRLTNFIVPNRSRVQMRSQNQQIDLKKFQDNLIIRLNNLPEDVRNECIQLLDQIEQGKGIDDQGTKLFVDLTSPSIVQLNYQLRKPSASSFTIDNTNQIQESTHLRSESPGVNTKLNMIMLRIISNHGDPRIVGITEIQILDDQSKQIKINDIFTLASQQLVQRLFNGHTFTINEDHMWWNEYTSFPIEIIISVGSDQQVTALRFWNYNKNRAELCRGVRQLEILINNEIRWNGELKKGSASSYSDYSQLIELTSINTGQLISQIQLKIDRNTNRFLPDTPKQRILNQTHLSNVSQQTKKSEDSVNLNRETFLSNVSNNNSKSQLNKGARHPKVLCNFFDEESRLRVSQAKPRDIQNTSGQAYLKQTPQDNSAFKLDNKGLILLKFPPEEASSQTSHKPLMNNFFQKFEKNTQVAALTPQQFSEEKRPVKINEFNRFKIERQLSGVAQIASGTNFKKQQFYIPELPQCSSLTFKLLRSWGDKRYIGLSAVELFNDNGEMIIQINGPEKLLDNHRMTSDGAHMELWETGSTEFVLDFKSQQRISLIRVWNFNKSRTYVNRGVKELSILADGKQEIFYGEIKKANGTLSRDNCEYILFTTNQQIINSIVQKDWVNHIEQKQMETEKQVLESTIKLNRPDTATLIIKNEKNQSLSKTKYNLQQQQPVKLFRGFTQPKELLKQQNSITNITTLQTPPINSQSKYSHRTSNSISESNPVIVKELKLKLIKSWGDRSIIGLNGLECYDAKGTLQVPRTITGPNQVYLKRLINPSFHTTNQDHVWSAEGQPEITLHFEQAVEISMIQIWNYNKRNELEKGAQIVQIKGDGNFLTSDKGIYLRKAPGLDHQDYYQTISLPAFDYKIQRVELITKQQIGWNQFEQDYETVTLPQGLQVKVNILSNWGDHFYVGLNGIEFFDQHGKIIQSQNLMKIIAKPHSVQEIPQMESDIRTPDKLLDGINVTLDDRHMWLAPFMNSAAEQLLISTNPSFGETSIYNHQLNTIIVMFQKPLQISAISLYNYAKSPYRGAREIEVFMDDALIYKGFINISTLLQNENLIEGNNKTTIVFTDEQEMIQKIGSVSMRQSIIGTDTVLINENQKMTYYQIANERFRDQRDKCFSYGQLQRPLTRVKGE